MNFQASDEQQQLADSLARVLQDHGAFEQRRAISKTEAGWNPALWGQLAQLGVTALGIPEAYGGLGRLDGQDEPGELSGGAVDRQLAMQAFGHALLLEPYLASCVLGATAVREAASPAQKEALLPGVAKGDYWVLYVSDDYKTAIVGSPSRRYMWLLSRTPTVSADTREDLLSRARQQGYDTTRLIWRTTDKQMANTSQ